MPKINLSIEVSGYQMEELETEAKKRNVTVEALLELFVTKEVQMIAEIPRPPDVVALREKNSKFIQVK